jgi:histidinol phosphatase-like PHP family hydrolase
LINRAAVQGYTAIGITDHVALGSLERMINEVKKDCALASKHWNIRAIPGVELTHLPVDAIDEIARAANEFGALLVVVHGETTAEPVPAGTNIAAINCPFVDILAHPGLITLEQAKQAAKNGVYLEISARRGHRDTNRHVAEVAMQAGARLLVNSDAHTEDDLLTRPIAEELLKKAGANKFIQEILEQNPVELLAKTAKNAG